MLQAVALTLVNAVSFYLIFVYLITWLKLAADMGARTALQINSLSMVILIGVVLVVSRLSDRIGRKPILTSAAVGLLVLAWPLFELMRTGEVLYVFLGQLGFTLLIGSFGSVNPIVLCEVFPRHVRCSAVSAAYNLSVGLAGGTAPAVATWLIEETGNVSMPAFYIMVCAAISAAAAFSLRESRQGSLGDETVAA
jgi:MFS transporter, MHS family, proline/betaine transporter